MMRAEKTRAAAAPVAAAPGVAPASAAAQPATAPADDSPFRGAVALAAVWAALYPVAGIVRLFMLGGGSVGFLPGACTVSLVLLIAACVTCRVNVGARRLIHAAAKAVLAPACVAACSLLCCAATIGLLVAPSIPVAFACYAASLALATPACARATLSVRGDTGRTMRATCVLALAIGCFVVLFAMQLAGVMGSMRNMALRTGTLLSLLVLVMLALAVLAAREGLAAHQHTGGKGGEGVAETLCAQAAPAPAAIPATSASARPAEVTSLTVESALNAVTLLGAAVAFVCGFFLSVFWANVLDAAGVLAAGLAGCAVVSAVLGVARTCVSRSPRPRAARSARRLGILALLAPCILASVFAVAAVIGFALGAGAGAFWCIGLLLAANALLAASMLCVPIKSLSAPLCAWRAILSLALFETMLVAGVLLRRVIGLDATHVVASAIGALTMLVVVFALVMVLALRKLLTVSEQTAAARQSAAAAASAADAAAQRAVAVQLAADERDRQREAEASSPRARLHDARLTVDEARRGFLGRFDLTERELSIALDFLDGRTMAATAEHLGISVNTVRYNMSKIYAKVGVQSKGELKAKADEALSEFMGADARR